MADHGSLDAKLFCLQSARDKFMLDRVITRRAPGLSGGRAEDAQEKRG